MIPVFAKSLRGQDFGEEAAEAMGLILSSLTLLSILELRFVSLLSLPPTNQFDERMLKSAIAPFTRRKFEDRCFVVML